MSSASSSASMSDWLGQVHEGQLSVDVFREGDELVIRSLVPGVRPEHLDISIHGDLLTIRGRRDMEREGGSDEWYYRECYWGGFSRSLVLPHEVAPESVTASLKNGVLDVRLTIQEHGKKVNIRWEE